MNRAAGLMKSNGWKGKPGAVAHVAKTHNYVAFRYNSCGWCFPMFAAFAIAAKRRLKRAEGPCWTWRGQDPPVGSAPSPVEMQFCTKPPVLGMLQVSPKLFLIRDFIFFAHQAFLNLQTPLSPPGYSRNSFVLTRLLPISAAGGPGHSVIFRAAGHVAAWKGDAMACPHPPGLHQTPTVPRPWALRRLLTQPFMLSPLVLLVSRPVFYSAWLDDSGLVLHC